MLQIPLKVPSRLFAPISCAVTDNDDEEQGISKLRELTFINHSTLHLLKYSALFLNNIK